MLAEIALLQPQIKLAVQSRSTHDSHGGAAPEDVRGDAEGQRGIESLQETGACHYTGFAKRDAEVLEAADHGALCHDHSTAPLLSEDKIWEFGCLGNGFVPMLCYVVLGSE